jgi:hypothetical protein
MAGPKDRPAWVRPLGATQAKCSASSYLVSWKAFILPRVSVRAPRNLTDT